MPEEINPRLKTIDLNFLGLPGTIAAYLITHGHGAILIESGPGSTSANLERALQSHGLHPSDITDVLLTHIHLDHAGAAGWLASHGARVHVHAVGAPHMVDPEKLLTSAQRIYGDMMDTLWGDFLPVRENQLIALQDGDVIEIEDLSLRAIDTPGHANHHMAYLFENVCFSGDIGGVRLAGLRHLRVPMPPPEFHLEKWRASVEQLSQETFHYIAPTHFGLYNDRDWHLRTLQEALDDIDQWIEAHLPDEPALETLNAGFLAWTAERSTQDELLGEYHQLYEAANPSWMSSQGILRYWKKFRSPQQTR